MAARRGASADCKCVCFARELTALSNLLGCVWEVASRTEHAIIGSHGRFACSISDGAYERDWRCYRFLALQDQSKVIAAPVAALPLARQWR